MNFAFYLALAGLLLLIWRMWPRISSSESVETERDVWPKVSIIVPARNEEKVLAGLLGSLEALDYPNFEIIVIDDCSQDRTRDIAALYKAKVIAGAPKPEAWFGKQWACHQGYKASQGELLLFTDADTMHRPFSLRSAVSFLLTEQADGISALPYHETRSFWETLCGPFYCILLAVTSPYGRPRRGRLFAIGQYLLFQRSSYEKLGGHEGVRLIAVEDLALANRLVEQGGCWRVWNGPYLFKVRMYQNLLDFVKGWRRNFRGGLRYGHPLSPLEITLFIAALCGGGQWQDGPNFAIILISALVLLRIQHGLGRFSVLGVLLAPFALGLFLLVTLLALWDSLLGNPLIWKNRQYA